MKSNATWVCILSVGMALVIAVVENSAKASEFLADFREGTDSNGTGAVATPESAPLIGPIAENARILVGHWRKTTIVFEQPKDEHLVLHADGTVENWNMDDAYRSRSATMTGRWNVEGKTLRTARMKNRSVSHNRLRFTRGSWFFRAFRTELTLLGKNREVEGQATVPTISKW